MLRKSIFRYKEYAFIDVIDHLYENVMKEAGIRIINVREASKAGSPYRLIFCMVVGVPEETFLKAINAIRNKAFILGYKDYDKYCDQLSTVRENIGI